MNLIKSGPNVALNPERKPIISITTSIVYEIPESGNVTPNPDKATLFEEAEYYEDISYAGYFQPSLLKRDIDFYAWKNKTDVVVQGTVRTPTPLRTLDFHLSCKGDKVDFSFPIRASGDRWIEKGRAGLEFTEPEPFTELPVRYDKAYGGTDEIAEIKNTDPDELEMYKKLLEEDDKEC